jgi:hypothetical protein
MIAATITLVSAAFLEAALVYTEPSDFEDDGRKKVSAPVRSTWATIIRPQQSAGVS